MVLVADPPVMIVPEERKQALVTRVATIIVHQPTHDVPSQHKEVLISVHPTVINSCIIKAILYGLENKLWVLPCFLIYYLFSLQRRSTGATTW